MKRVIFRLAAAAAFVLSLTIQKAHSHWQYTRWGMDTEQVLAAAKDNKDKVIPARESQKNSTDNSRNLLDSTYQTGRFIFDVRFLFDNSNKLRSVKLVLVNPKECLLLEGQLLNTYGRAEVSKRSAITNIVKWWDKKNGNVLTLFGIGDVMCSVEYSEYREAGTKGGL
jgi:hypothetical protein